MNFFVLLYNRVEVSVMEFKDKLKAKRKELNLTQQQVADAINVSRSVVAKWETGLVMPKDEVLVILAELLRVNPVDLLTDKDDIETLLISKNKLMKKRNYIIYSLIAVVILLIVIPFILNNSKYRNIKNPIVTSIELDEDIPVFSDTYYLTDGEEYDLYFEVLVPEKTYRLNPIFYIQDIDISMISSPYLISEEKIDSKTFKLKYKAVFTTSGAFKEKVNIEIYWNYHNNSSFGVMCPLQTNNVFTFESNLLSTVPVHFYYLNKPICTYNIKRGTSINDLLFNDGENESIYDCSNEGELINALLNSEFIDVIGYISYPVESPSYIYCLSELGFNGWIREDGKSLDELVFEETKVFATFVNPRIDFSDFVEVRDDIRIGISDYLEPLFTIMGEHTKNVQYKLFSESDIVSIIDGKYKLTDYGIATITVEFDFGFCQGTTTFIVERKESGK